MPPPLAPHRAHYTIAGADGSPAGSEDLVVERVDMGYRIRSELTADFPARLHATVEWELDPALTTRLLVIHSRDGWAQDYELELTVTGNGLLAHRAAPDGPTQVELGWGPDAEVDYLSAAFPAVMVARSRLEVGVTRRVDLVQVGAEDLVPRIVPCELRRLEAAGDNDRYASTVIATGHQATLAVGPSGALLDYEGLLRADSVAPLPAPTK